MLGMYQEVSVHPAIYWRRRLWTSRFRAYMNATIIALISFALPIGVFKAYKINLDTFKLGKVRAELARRLAGIIDIVPLGVQDALDSKVGTTVGLEQSVSAIRCTTPFEKG
ncbi:hypothetical protein AG1IA_08775 [Rhizoctonia solani AG-1 IA]|uniref:Uncharacterized protein n=1 Tax=Thanatephorus cucumeris (strain AG1-IA) TaxID=983506 RepID=L8WGZ3_THACA|nr:hypothetical protein AG1IA_08775 [Rhizoctonia solani AG-1 IA]